MGRSTRKKKPTQEKFEPLVTAPFVSVASRVSHMLRGLLKGSLQKMGQLFSHEESRSTNVATFLALLELIRAGRVKVDDSGHLAAGPHTPQKKGQNAMTERQELGSLEAMLFAHAEPVETARLADALRLDADEVTTALLQKLQKRYEEQESGMVSCTSSLTAGVTTRPYYGEMVKRILDTRRNAPLSPAALEVLAVIAYNQPVSRSFIEQVRGVDSSSTVTKLLDKGLIEEAGRLDLPGKPVAFQVTDTFLRVFGLGSLADLPPLHGEAAESAEPGGDGRRRRSAGMEVIAYGHSVVPSPTDRLGAAGGALAAARRPADTTGRSVCVPPGQRAGHGLLRTAALHALAAQGQPEALKKPASAAPPGQTVRKTADGEQASVTVEVKPDKPAAQTVARQPAAQGSRSAEAC